MLILSGSRRKSTCVTEFRGVMRNGRSRVWNNRQTKHHVLVVLGLVSLLKLGSLGFRRGLGLVLALTKGVFLGSVDPSWAWQNSNTFTIATITQGITFNQESDNHLVTLIRRGARMQHCLHVNLRDNSSANPCLRHLRTQSRNGYLNSQPCVKL